MSDPTRRAQLEVALRDAADWDWNAARSGIFDSFPHPVIEWDESGNATIVPGAADASYGDPAGSDSGVADSGRAQGAARTSVPVANHRSAGGAAQLADRIARRQWLRWFWLPGFVVDPRRRCPHDCQQALYGDEIIDAGFRRSRCLDCGRLLRSLPRKGQVCRHGRSLR